MVLYRLFAASRWLWLCKFIYPFHLYPGIITYLLPSIIIIITYPLPSIIIIIIINNPLPYNHLISLITKTTQVCSPDYSTVSYCQPGLDPEVVDSQYCDYGDCWADQFNGLCTYEISKKNQARGPTDCTQVNPEGGYVCSEDYTTLVSFLFLYFFISLFYSFFILLTAFVFFFCSTNALVA